MSRDASKTIQVSDQIFRRLQKLAEPLVDTPAGVIERLLNEHDQRIPLPNPGTGSHQQLFLAPATSENLKQSVIQSVTLQYAEQHLLPDQFRRLKSALHDRSRFACWAMTESNRTYWKAMNPGDVVLLTEKGTGRFGYRAEVATTLESDNFGRNLWSVTPGKPWSLIYILDHVQPISISKPRLLRELGYDPGYVVPGTVRVADHRLKKTLEEHKSLDQFLSWLTNRS